MTYMSGMMSLVAAALVATLVVRTMRRDRALRRDARDAPDPFRADG